MYTLALTLLLAVAPCSQAATDEDVVRSTTSAILEQVNQNRDRLQKDPQVIQQLINRMLAPYFDFDRMGQLVLGTCWEDLDADAQICFIQGYRNLLVERYVYILLSYDNNSIRYEPSREIGDLGYRQLRQIISTQGGAPVSVDYAMEESGGSWKVVDLVIDSVSLVRNYRGMYQSQINLQGLDYFNSNFQGRGNEHIVQ